MINHRILLSLLLAVFLVSTLSACSNELKEKSPFYGRGSTGGLSTNGSQPTGGTTTSGTSLTGFSGRLTNISISKSGAAATLNATYVSNAGVSLPIQISTSSTAYPDGQKNSGNNGSYFYVESNCVSYSSGTCDEAYFAVYVIDYLNNTGDPAYKFNNFGVAKIGTGATQGQYYSNFPQSADYYITVDYVMSQFAGGY
jgi:hypothetical protein